MMIIGGLKEERTVKYIVTFTRFNTRIDKLGKQQNRQNMMW